MFAPAEDDLVSDKRSYYSEAKEEEAAFEAEGRLGEEALKNPREPEINEEQEDPADYPEQAEETPDLDRIGV